MPVIEVPRGAGDVDGGEGAAAVPQEAMEHPGGVQVLADDLAAVVDIQRNGCQGAGDIDGGEDAIVQQKAMGTCRSASV